MSTETEISNVQSAGQQLVDGRGYRGFDGALRSQWSAIWPIARTGMLLVFRKKAFWLLLGLALLDFLFLFATFYLVAQLQAGIGGARMGNFLRGVMKMADGTAERYFEFMVAQATITMLLLAFAGTLLVGNDHRLGGLVFYLSKRLTTAQYFCGKLLSICLLVLLVTTVPALVLFIEYGMLQDDYSYFQENWSTVFGIVGYGLVMGGTLSLILVALGSWIHRTIPLVLSWAGIFAFLPVVAEVLHEENFGEHWLLMNLWYCMRIFGRWCFGILKESQSANLPWAAFVLVVVAAACVLVTWPRIKAVQIVQ